MLSDVTLTVKHGQLLYSKIFFKFFVCFLANISKILSTSAIVFPCEGFP